MGQTANNAMIKGLWDTVGPPELQEGEAVRAAKKLIYFGLGEGHIPKRVRVDNTRRTWVYSEQADKKGELGRDVLIVSKRGGWPTLVFDLARYCNTNDIEQEMELKMVREIIERGWLDGRLRDRLIPRAEQRVLKRAAKVKSLRQRIKAWEAKERRARNALKKARAQLKRMEKTQ